MNHLSQYLYSLALLLCTIHLTAQVDHLRNEVDKIIKYDTQLEIDDNPGFIISIIDQDSIYHLPYGKVYSDSNTAPTQNDIYEMGSITKSFTALLTLALQERGILSLTDSINQYITEYYQNDEMSGVTIHDLLIHQSGLPISPDFIGKKTNGVGSPYENYDKIDLLNFYKKFNPKDKKSFKYSHTNYGLLEIILENATESSIEYLFDQYIFSKLLMHQTHMMNDSTAVTIGYDKANRERQPWKYKSHYASEGIVSTSTDLIKFVKAQFADKSNSLTESIKECQKIQIEKSLNKSISSTYGWHISNRKSGQFPIYTNTGRTSGHNAFIAFVKETKTAVIILSNSVLGTEDLGMQILRMINYNWKRKAN